MDLIQRRRQLMGMQMGGLPGAYQAVEYIGSTNDVGQYINTGIEVNESIVIRAKWVFSESKAWQAPFGGRGSTLSIQRYSSTESIQAESYGSQTRVYSGNSSTGIIFETVYSTTQVVIDGTTVSINKGTLVYPNNIIWLFGKQNVQATGIDVKGGCNIYYCEISDANSLIRNFVPCIRKSDSKPGMYDTVTKTFFTNAGSGEFIVPA